jgi:hypothetical protein
VQALLVLHQPLHQPLEEERRRAKASAYAAPCPPTAAAAPLLPLSGRLPQPLLQLGRAAKSSASFANSSRASKSATNDPVWLGIKDWVLLLLHLPLQVFWTLVLGRQVLLPIEIFFALDQLLALSRAMPKPNGVPGWRY